MKTILLGVSGSISAYKAADITNELTKLGYQVDVVMTRNSQQFITPLTLQSLSKRNVHLDVMEEPDVALINHIELAKRADLFLVAPASANIIGKLANGIADDILSTVALPLKKQVPKVVVPAMNVNMYENPVLQMNLEKLKALGYHEIEPRESLLACGDFGKGALATTATIISGVQEILADKV